MTMSNRCENLTTLEQLKFHSKHPTLDVFSKTLLLALNSQLLGKNKKKKTFYFWELMLLFNYWPSIFPSSCLCFSLGQALAFLAMPHKYHSWSLWLDVPTVSWFTQAPICQIWLIFGRREPGISCQPYLKPLSTTVNGSFLLNAWFQWISNLSPPVKQCIGHAHLAPTSLLKTTVSTEPDVNLSAC